MEQHTATERSTPPHDLTVHEAAEILRVSDFTMRAKVAGGEFAGAYKVGIRWRIPAADIETYKERHRVVERQTLPTHSPRSEAARRAAATRRRTA